MGEPHPLRGGRGTIRRLVVSESVEAEQQFGLGAPASASMAVSHRNLRTREIRSLVFLLSPCGYFLGMDGSSTMPVSRSREPGYHTPHRSSMISMPQFPAKCPGDLQIGRAS